MATDPRLIFEAQAAGAAPQGDLIRTMAGPAASGPMPVDGAGGGMHGQRGLFRNYIPDGLVRMLIAAQAQRPDFFANLMQRPRMERRFDQFGLTPETDFANLYTRSMARGDMQAGNPMLTPGTILTPDQRAAYPALAPWPQYAGGGMGNNAPAQGGGHGPKAQRPIGLAERTAPAGGTGGTGY